MVLPNLDTCHPVWLPPTTHETRVSTNTDNTTTYQRYQRTANDNQLPPPCPILWHPSSLFQSRVIKIGAITIGVSDRWASGSWPPTKGLGERQIPTPFLSAAIEVFLPSFRIPQAWLAAAYRQSVALPLSISIAMGQSQELWCSAGKLSPTPRQRRSLSIDDQLPDMSNRQ
ncbi:hypothetical protein BO99DRAFT_97831 [Aspergillus violaceofuscus CBS 115571]|uniref:Uncharacterized protein n=1 Tax=Aspergillus violaceofuscus (strain CBS 115571) TaxID=1450538 RepID=A0A2V5HGY9_ASPV1|nr:hypothetical protein BO99DRAFT_97831 [Aspergillus violaceofuscus CBS 115571]